MSALRPDATPFEEDGYGGDHFNPTTTAGNTGGSSGGFRESLDVNDWTQRWKVVTSTKTRMVRNLVLHGALVALLLSFAIAIGVAGKHTVNSESLCILRTQPSSNWAEGQSGACARPIATATIAIIISLAMCAYNVRSLQVYKPRDRRIVLAQAGLAFWMAVMTVWAASWAARAKSATCEGLPPGPESCSQLYEKYFERSLGGLTFGIVMGFFAGVGWLVSAYHEFQTYRSSDGI
ncbi:hypothetical protein BDZ88DRAFT_451823 [Geranomyces variabilis]|nr:hypothetical protein BDZ88DRAFT_451823 [Geranomyces variabilis]KAJ3135234.1 hypothetical protein HDU90_003957 [Geranomyces variabilis]